MTTYAYRRKDSNQDAIVDALRKLGIKVFIFGEECDLICQYSGVTMLAEVRPADKPKVARKGRQAKFQEQFQVYWLQTNEDCINLANTLRRWHDAITISPGRA